jgi:hypothetical protein
MTLLIIMVTLSCKKTDDTPAPDPIPNPKPTPNANIFQTGFPKMMTDQEIMGHKKFAGSLIYQVGVGLQDDDPKVPYAAIFKFYYNICYPKPPSQTQTDFNQINSELSTISNQIADLKNEITSLSQQLSMAQTNILNKLNSLVANVFITSINDAFDSATSQGLMYYSKTAAQIQNGQNPMTMAELNAKGQTDFVANYGPSGSGNPMPLAISNLQGLIIGSTSGPVFANSDIKQFADEIIQAQQSPNSEETYAMNCYKILENYFLISLNSQIRAFTVYSNALYGGEDSIQANYDYNLYLQSFKTIIQSELSMFLTVTDYLAVNLTDYRATTIFGTDMLWYFNYGLQPDNTCGSFIARANMLNQLVNAALGAQTKDMYVTISVPKNYGNSSNMSWTGPNGTNPLTIDNQGSFNSQFPYTAWNGSTCSPDNHVTFYRGNGGDAGSSQSTVSTMSITINGAAWRQIKPLLGVASIGYYNPNDISAAPQSTYSSTYCLAFGSVSCDWYWGYLYLNDNDNNNIFQAAQVNWGNGTIWNDSYHSSPVVMTFNENDDKTSSYASNFTWGDTYVQYSGTFPKYSHGGDYLTTGMFRSGEINVGANNATYYSTISFYFYYSVTPFNWKNSEEWYFAGTNIVNNWTNGSLLYYDVKEGSTKPSESATSTADVSSGINTFNVGFCGANEDETGNSNNCNITWYSQVIYGGTYNIWSK